MIFFFISYPMGKARPPAWYSYKEDLQNHHLVVKIIPKALGSLKCVYVDLVNLNISLKTLKVLKLAVTKLNSQMPFKICCQQNQNKIRIKWQIYTVDSNILRI